MGPIFLVKVSYYSHYIRYLVLTPHNQPYNCLFFPLVTDLIDRGDETHSFSIQQTSFVAIFLFASYQQNLVHRTLASYRKSMQMFFNVQNNCIDYFQKVNFFLLEPGTEDKYTLPKGGWFNYVSCPNYLCEIIIYVSLYFTLGSHHVPWGIITTWVVTNQV